VCAGVDDNFAGGEYAPRVCVCARVFADLLTEEKREQRKQVKRRTGVEEMMMGKVARTTVS
jgi:hypothetical protein